MKKIRKNNKGFTLIELMIVVAIIGILAAVAIPMYKVYIQKSRFASACTPTIHAVQTNAASWRSLKAAFPTDLTILQAEASTAHIALSAATAAGVYTFVVNGASDQVGALVDTYGSPTITCTATMDGEKIIGWVNTGKIAEGLGMD